MVDEEGRVRTQICIYLIVKRIEHIITITITDGFLSVQRFALHVVYTCVICK